MLPVETLDYTYEDSYELFRSLKSSDDKELFQLFNFHTCYPTLSDNPSIEDDTMICQCTIENLDYTFTRHLNDARYSEYLFSTQDGVFTTLELFHFLFQQLPDSTRKNFIERCYDENQSNTSLASRFNRHLDKLSSFTLTSLASKFLQPYNFSLDSSKKGLTSFSFQVKNSSERFSLHITRFSPYSVYFKFTANDSSNLKNNPYVHLFAPLQDEIQEKYPDISFSSFCTSSSKSSSELYDFLLDCYKKSNEYKIHSMFNDFSI